MNTENKDSKPEANEYFSYELMIPWGKRSGFPGG